MRKADKTYIRVLRAEELLDEARTKRKEDAKYAGACIELAILELQCALKGGDPAPSKSTLKCFNKRQHTFCRFVAEQCVLCGGEA